MTIIVGYIPRPEGRAALDKGIEIAKRRNERLIVVNASHDGEHADASMVDAPTAEHLEQELATSGVNYEFKQFIRGHNVVQEIEDLVAAHDASLLVIGIRKRTAIGKLIMGSVAQELLLSVPCPVLAVKG